jgi:hypothetical protein
MERPSLINGGNFEYLLLVLYPNEEAGIVSFTKGHPQLILTGEFENISIYIIYKVYNI